MAEKGNAYDPEGAFGAFARTHPEELLTNPAEPHREWDVGTQIFAQDANGDEWWKEGQKGQWRRGMTYKEKYPSKWAELHPDNMKQWKEENPGKEL